MSQEAGIALTNVSHAYGNAKVLDGVNLVVPKGQSMALLGPNGAGKSTLMNIVGALIRPGAGQVMLDGVDMGRSPQKARRSLGIVFQDDSLDDRLTAWENLEFHGLVYGMARRERARRIDEVLALVELEQWRDSPVRQYSGGMKRRLEIARALLHEPTTLLLDEPTVGLDAHTRARIWDYLDLLQRSRGTTVFISTHYLDEADRCDLVCILDHGKVEAVGAPAALKARFGKTIARLLPRDAAAKAAILARWPETSVQPSGHLVLAIADSAQLDALLAGFGAAMSEIKVLDPSLETVFLNVTGRELRDGAAPENRAPARKAKRR